VHHWMCILHNQRNAIYTMFLSSAGVVWVEHTNHTSGRQQESMTMPKAAHTVL